MRSVTATRRELEQLGKLWLRYIRVEAARDRGLSGGEIPTGEPFLASFRYRVVGAALELTSDWPWFELLFDGTGGPYRMRWLTRAAGVARVPFRQPDGRVVFRATPLTAADAWVHPGVRRYEFVQRAYRRALQETAVAIAARLIGESFDGRRRY